MESKREFQTSFFQAPSPTLPYKQWNRSDTFVSTYPRGCWQEAGVSEELGQWRLISAVEEHNTAVPTCSHQDLGSQEVRQSYNLRQCLFGRGEDTTFSICSKNILQASQALFHNVLHVEAEPAALQMCSRLHFWVQAYHAQQWGKRHPTNELESRSKNLPKALEITSTSADGYPALGWAGANDETKQHKSLQVHACP